MAAPPPAAPTASHGELRAGAAGSTQVPRFHLFSYLLGLLTALVLTGGSLLLLRRPDPPPIALQPPPTSAPTATALPTATPGPIVVFVSGAVHQPGTVTLVADARVADALAAAGGLRAEADATAVNQAERVWDGAQIHVPAAGDEPALVATRGGLVGLLPTPTAAAGGAAAAAGGQVNLNTASAAELETLPGIGASKAEAIIANRPYATVDDLDRVPGIGTATLGQLRPLVVAP